MTSSRVMKNPFDHPPDPLPSQEGAFCGRGERLYLGNTPRPPPEGAPLRRGRPLRRGTPSGLPFFSNLLEKDIGLDKSEVFLDCFFALYYTGVTVRMSAEQVLHIQSG